MRAAPAGRYYLAEVGEAYAQAIRRSGEIVRHYRLGPQALRLRFAGNALVHPLTFALGHLEIPATEPALTVRCWDSQSSGVAMPHPPWPNTAYGAKGHITGYNDETLRTLYKPDMRTLNLYDAAAREGLFWMESAQALPFGECSFPLRNLLHWWSLPQALQPVHAGAVGNENGAVLLAGKSGSGKSTGALACLAAGMHYLGDDYVMIENTRRPMAYSLYGTAKLHPRSLVLLPQLAKAASPQKLAGDKSILLLNEHFPDRLRACTPLRAVLLPHVGEVTRLRPATPVEALMALAPTTIMQLEGGSREAYGKMSGLVKTLPCLWLELGDVAQLPDVIAGYLARHAWREAS